MSNKVDYSNMSAAERLAFCRGNEQHQSKPVTLPARLPMRSPEDRNLPKGYAQVWNACLAEVEKLGPLYTRPAPGEPVYQLRNKVVGNVWRDADKEAYDSAAKLVEYERRILYTHADPAEVERLRNAVDFYCKLSNEVIDERETLAQTLIEQNALLREIAVSPIKDHIRRKIDSALSASAEPAPQPKESQ